VNSHNTTGFRGDIQGLRAIAVASVLLYHANMPFITGGYVGVDVFFVISGFLITSHLLSQLRTRGRVDFPAFYARRVRRILPASLVVVALSTLGAVIWYPPMLIREVWKGAVASALYVPNYLFAVEGTDYLSEQSPSLFQHYWSLGVEEQFYLVWPVLLGLGFLAMRSRARRLFLLVAGLTVASFIAGAVLTYHSQPWAFFSLPTRAWELGAGGLAAFVAAYRPDLIKAGPVLGWVGVAGILASLFLFDSSTSFPGIAAALPVLSTAAVILAGVNASSFGPAAVLSLRPFQFIGLTSYSLYLVHWPLFLLINAAVFQAHLSAPLRLGIALLCVPLAWLLYRFVEAPARDGRWLKNARPRRSLLAAAVAPVIVALIATGSFLYVRSVPLHADAAAQTASISAAPAFTGFVPSNLKPSLSEASTDQAEIYDDGCHATFTESDLKSCVYGDPKLPRIVLFGDSHAAHWFPALKAFAASHGYSLESRTKSSCPSVLAGISLNGVPYTSCAEWRQKVIDRINSEPVALVVVSNYAASLPRLLDGESWEKGLRKTLDSIRATTVVLADTPDLKVSTPVCLSAKITAASACGKARSAAFTPQVQNAERAAAAGHGSGFIDLSDYLCSADRCDPIIGDTLVYRDGHHLTATFSTKLAQPLGEKLAPYLHARQGTAR